MPQAKLDKPVPNLKVQATGEKTFKLRELAGKNIVLYFYPKDNTPGCTTEGRDFRDHYGRFKRLKTEVFGVSRDSLKSHENFKAKQDFPFDLISDPDETLCKAFDVIKEKTLYGKKHLGIERSTFIIDNEGTVRREFRKVKVAGHVEEVLQAIKDL